jgi:hypothetical protein
MTFCLAFAAAGDSEGQAEGHQEREQRALRFSRLHQGFSDSSCGYSRNGRMRHRCYIGLN